MLCFIMYKCLNVCGGLGSIIEPDRGDTYLDFSVLSRYIVFHGIDIEGDGTKIEKNEIHYSNESTHLSIIYFINNSHLI